MEYVLYDEKSSRYIRFPDSGKGYSPARNIESAARLPWKEIVEAYHVRIARKRQQDFTIRCASPVLDWLHFQPDPGDPEPDIDALVAERARVEQTNAARREENSLLARLYRPEVDTKSIIHFMADYENVREGGLEGVSYLTEADRLTLFFSDSAPNIQLRNLDAIVETGCRFDICSLENRGNNALDFYIVSKIGEVFGRGFDGRICIVSKDTGFNAVMDYWSNHAETKHKVVRWNTIEQGIVALDGKSARGKTLREKARRVNIREEYARIDEQKSMRFRLRQLFAGTDLADQMDGISEMLDQRAGKKVIYLNAMRIFGRERGREVYSRLKGANLL